MKYTLVLIAFFSVVSLAAQRENTRQVTYIPPASSSSNTKACSVNNNVTAVTEEATLSASQPLLISVVGQGVAPVNTASPAQAYALAKRAAIADAYRLIAEKVKGVRIDGKDLVKNMMVQRSTVRTSVEAMVRNANIVETTFKEGLCEVEMEITLLRNQFPH